MIDENTWGMMLGRSGQLPGELAPELMEMARQQGREFFTDDPQDLYPDQLDDFRAKMKEKGWDTGQDDEELFEYAMHPAQYEDFMSGNAKKKFEADLAKRKAEAEGGSTKTASVPLPVAVGSAGASAPAQPRNLIVNVDGTKYKVDIEYPGADQTTANAQAAAPAAAAGPDTSAEGHYVTSPLEGKFFLTKSPGEQGIKVGDKVKAGETVAYVESMKVINSITTSEGGTIADILVSHGDDIEEDQPLVRIS